MSATVMPNPIENGRNKQSCKTTSLWIQVSINPQHSDALLPGILERQFKGVVTGQTRTINKLPYLSCSNSQTGIDVKSFVGALPTLDGKPRRIINYNPKPYVEI